MAGLCSTCFLSLTGRPRDQVVHGCCQRKVCSQCTARNSRLATYCPFCDDALSALRKRRTDVFKAGDTLFDLNVAEDQGVLLQSVHFKEPSSALAPPTAASATVPHSSSLPDPPPAYSPAPEFTIGDELDTLEDTPASSAHKNGSTVRLDDVEATKPSLPDRLVGLHSTAISDPQGLVQYYLQPHDTVAGIALRFRCSRAEMCAINGLPRTAMHTPSALHTRRYIYLPSGASTLVSEAKDGDQPPAYSQPQLEESFTPNLMPSECRRAAQVRFQALVLRHMRAEGPGALFPDTRAAEVYVSLAEAELTASGEIGPTALVNLAVSHWMMDSNWERRQRVQGNGPSSIRLHNGVGENSSSSSTFLSHLLRSPMKAMGMPDRS